MNDLVRNKENWRKVKLGDICDIAIGGTPSRDKPEYWDPNKETGNIWISIRDLSNNGKYIENSSEYISESGIKHSNVKPIEKDTVIMSFKLSIGKTAITKTKVYSNEAIAAFVIKDKTLLNPEFLYYVVPRLKYEVDTAVKGATLNKEKLKNTELFIPPLSEQLKIATILSKVDEEIEKVDQTIEKTEQLKKGLMQNLLTKGIGHTKFKQTELGEIPEEWKLLQFSDFATLQRGFDLPANNRNKGEYPLVSSNGITDTHSECMAKGPGVITGRSGTIGKVFFVEKNFWPLNTTLYIKNFHNNNPKFVYYFLKKLDLKSFQTGTGVPTLNRNIIHQIKIAIPPLEEQKKIAKILESLEDFFLITKSKKKLLIKLKKGLMQNLLHN